MYVCTRAKLENIVCDGGPGSSLFNSFLLHPLILNIYKENYFIISFYFTEKYFDMNKKLARDALDIYKKFLIRMDRVADFLKVAEVRKS